MLATTFRVNSFMEVTLLEPNHHRSVRSGNIWSIDWGLAMLRAWFFGEFQVQAGDRPVDQLSTGRVSSLFRYLLLNRERTVRREKLHEVLRPGREWSPKDSSLKVAVHSLRQVLKDVAAQTGEPPVEVVGHDHGYVLRAKDAWLDVDEFDRHVNSGRRAENAGDLDRAMSCFRQAADLYRDDFLVSDDAEWATARRECDRALALDTLSWLRANAIRRGSDQEVISLCRRILEIDPYHEEMYQTLMLVHGRRGELGQVRNWHQMCVRRLRDDLDLAPTDTTGRIYARAVRGKLREGALSA
jgi:DNA-binding SARP family transcriptional activator